MDYIRRTIDLVGNHDGFDQMYATTPTPYGDMMIIPKFLPLIFTFYLTSDLTHGIDST